MPIPDNLIRLPLSDMILRAMTDPGVIVLRERTAGRAETMADWRARAVWEALFECGIDPARTFVSSDAMRAFDETEGDARYPTARPGWLGEGQDHPCGRCGAQADMVTPHHCQPKPAGLT